MQIDHIFCWMFKVCKHIHIQISIALRGARLFRSLAHRLRKHLAEPRLKMCQRARKIRWVNERKLLIVWHVGEKETDKERKRPFAFARRKWMMSFLSNYWPHAALHRYSVFDLIFGDMLHFPLLLLFFFNGFFINTKSFFHACLYYMYVECMNNVLLIKI